jgi:hypothetical protein
MLHVPGLVIIAGTGRKVGKTTVACRVIDLFRKSNITAVKISSHFHEPQNHLVLFHRGGNYIIWEETSSASGKDSSMFLKFGATRSFYIQAERESSPEAFEKLLDMLPYSTPIVCESPSLANGVIPGALIIVSGKAMGNEGEKELSFLSDRRAFRLNTDDVDADRSVPLILDETGFHIL